MKKIRPIAGMTTPRFADIATFFRLPVFKDLKKLDYCICGVPWDGGTTNRPGARHGPREVRNASSMIRLYFCSHTLRVLSFELIREPFQSLFFQLGG